MSLHNEVCSGQDSGGGESNGTEAAVSASGRVSEVGTDRAPESAEEQLLRLRAEFDNFRKRIERERAEEKDRLLAQQAARILPVLDALERAAEGPATGEAVAYQEGVERIRVQLAGILHDFGLREVSGAGEKFDPSVHEALATEESEGQPVDTVIEVLQKGYRLNDRLIRPARVKVAKGVGE